MPTVRAVMENKKGKWAQFMNARLTPMRELLQYAEERGIAIGAFEFWSFEVARAALTAADELSLPVILQCGKLEIDRMGGLDGTVEALLRAAKDVKAPVALHLDHATSEEYCRAAVDAGFSSVMFDGSALPYEENSATTWRVCEYAHSAGASCEGELGRLRGEEGAVSSPEAAQTDPQEALRFCQETGVDAFAPSIGTAHGVYTFEPHLNISRLRQIRALLPKTPLVLHGGSGTPMDQVQETIRNGIRKVNICTEIQIAMGHAYMDVQSRPGFKYNCDALWGAGEAAARALISSKMRAFALMDA